MNVQGRRGGISCDNKGDRLIHKKKSGWRRAQPLSRDGRRGAVTARTRSRRPQARGRAALILLHPRSETPRARVGESQTGLGDRGAGGSCTLGPGLEKDTGPAGGFTQRPSSEAPRALFPSGPRAGHVHVCTRTRTDKHTHRYIHTRVRSALPRTLPPAPAARPLIRPASSPDPAGRLCWARRRVHTHSHAPRDPWAAPARRPARGPGRTQTPAQPAPSPPCAPPCFL